MPALRLLPPPYSYIDPGAPWQNAFVESSRVRDELLNACARQSPLAMPEEGLEPPTRGL